jgi:hypothetical protein
VLDLLEQFTLNNAPSSVNITTDESKDYYWLTLVQTDGDHWSHVEATCYALSTTVVATISDTRPLTVGFNLGSMPTVGVIEQPGLGLPATTYLIKGGGNNHLHNYDSGYLTTCLATAGQFTVTISAVEAELSVTPTMVSGWQTSAATVTAVFRDRLDNPIPDGAIVQFSTTEGTFPDGSSTFTKTATGGEVTTTLTMSPTANLAEIAAKVGNVTGFTSVAIIYPAVEVLVTPHTTSVYVGEAVTYTYQITNTGNITLTNVTLTDDNGTPGDGADDFTVCQAVTMTARSSAVYSRSATLIQTTVSTCTLTARDPLGNDVTGSASVTVTVQPLEEPNTYIYLPVVIRIADG